MSLKQIFQSHTLTSLIRPRAIVPKVYSRSIHLPPKLHNQSSMEQNGIPGLYSPKGFKTAWTDYQNYLTFKLTQLTADTENETRHPFAIVLNTAKKQTHTTVFNIASQAHNNHLFFGSLTSPETNGTKPHGALLSRITSTFGSVEEFRTAFLLQADIMFGNGWVFLVEDSRKALGIMPCNNAGTPYDFARNQSIDFNGPISDVEANHFAYLSKAVNDPNVKDWTIPLLAVNVWQHAFMDDYGFSHDDKGYSGKSEYLKNWWDSINWDIVGNRLYTPKVK